MLQQEQRIKRTAAPRFTKNREGLYKSLLPVAAFVLVILVNAIFTRNFLRVGVGPDGLLTGMLVLIGRHATPVILMAMAMTLVIATKGIDLSVGAVAAISGVMAAVMLMQPHPTHLALTIVNCLGIGGQSAAAVASNVDLGLIIAFCLGIGALAGIWNGILVSYLKIQPFIATLILMVAGRGIAQLLPKLIGETEGTILTLPLDNPHSNPIFKHFCDLGNGGAFFLPYRFYLVALVGLITWFIARKTVCGTYIEAVGSNETAAKYCGINAQLVKTFVYAFSGLCAALAGLLLTAQAASADANTMALRDHNELDVILAVIVGGTAFSGGKFNLFGSLIGALTMRTLILWVQSSGLNWGYALVLRALAVIIVCLIQAPAFRSAIAGAFKRRSA